MVKYSGWFICAVLVITLLLVPPIFLMAPTQQASQDSGGPVFELQERVQEQFPLRIHGTGFIVEDRQGDILRQQSLWELYQNQERLRASGLGRFLYNGYDADNQRQVFGVFTIADGVNKLLALDPEGPTTLENATDRQVKVAVHRLLASPTGRLLRDSLSRDASFEVKTINGQPVEFWRAAALFSFVASDNALLGGGPPILSLSNNPVTLGKERFNRRVQEILRGSQTHYRLWGLAIDVNLESREQGRSALPFIAATVLLVLLVVGITLKSARAAGFTFLGLLMVLVWLKGGSNLVGLNSSLTLDLIVPIAVISLGVDFFIHAAARYQEECSRGAEPSLALGTGLTRVIGALTLAMLSDGIAFLANVTAGIETVIGFGVAAGIAVAAAYLVMGLFLPVLMMRLDRRSYQRSLRPALGTLSQPYPGTTPGNGSARTHVPGQPGFASLVVGLVRFRWIVLSTAAVVTVVSTYLAFQLEPRLDVKEFFDSKSDLVVGLDKLEQHVDQDLSGEPGIIYLEGDLTAPESLAAIQDLLSALGENPHLGSNGQGEVTLYRRTVLTLLSRLTGSAYARSQVEVQTGVAISDDDDDGLPDKPEQIQAAYDYMTRFGVPSSPENLIYDAIQVQETIFHQPGPGQPDLGELQATILIFGVLGTRQQANLALGREALERDLKPLREVSSISIAGVTGSPFTRESTLHAATKALNTSLPVAAAACFLLLGFWMRSLRFALVTIVPMGLVVSWLYAFMHLAGFHLNFVTATIAAVSIGLGIDYSIHVTQRYRQEMRWAPDPVTALVSTASGTGVALAGSAASSIIGFGVLGFAPMPLFSAYGIITATMIAMAAAAALLVLPSLLTMASGSQVRSVG